MSDAVAVSALNGASFEGAVKIRECGLRGMITLRGDLGSEAMAKAVKGATGLAVPGVRKVKLGKKGGVAWMSPDELLVMVDYDATAATVAKLESALAGEHHLAVDVSDARAVFAINGAGARDVLAKGAPVDLSPEAFGMGDIRRSRLGQVAAAFWMTDKDCFELVCFRSVGGFVYDWLCTAGAENSLPGHF